jgi:hypothetical protein
MGTESDRKLYELWKSTPRGPRIFWGTVGLVAVAVSVYSLVNPNAALSNLVRIPAYILAFLTVLYIWSVVAHK